MNTTLLNGFTDELEKISVDTRVLLRNVRKAKNVSIGRMLDNPMSMMGGGGVTTSPSRKATNALVKKKIDETVAKVTKDSFRDAPAKKRIAANQLASMSRKITKKPADWVGGKQWSQGGKANAGKIQVSPEMAGNTFATLARKRGPRRMAERGAMGATVAAHELFERGSKKIAPVFSHLHPEVLLKEHNLVSRLTGPGSKYTRSVMRGARKRSGEDKFVRQLLTEAYGPRAAQFTREGAKIPKAMRKNLRKKIEQNPAILDRAMRGVKPPKLGKMEQGIMSVRALRDMNKGMPKGQQKKMPDWLRRGLDQL